MSKLFIRVLAFYLKEFNEVYRQPKLILSLILAPFMVLILFGMGYRTDPPRWRTILVIPSEVREQIPLDDIQHAILRNFHLIDIQAEPEEALQQLRRGLVDLVVVVPSDIQEQVLEGHRSPIAFKYNEINPFNEQGLRYLAYAQVNEINRALLLQATGYAQEEASTTQELLVDMRVNLENLEEGITTARRSDLRSMVEDLRRSLDVIISNPFFELVGQHDEETQETKAQLQRLHNDLLVLEEALDDDMLDEYSFHVSTTRERIATIEQEVARWRNLPPEVIISPFQHASENVRGASLDFMSFYAPGVLALIVQHMAIMLGALSLVRERRLGALELYRVTPISVLQMLIGKYASYTLLIGVISALLLWLMKWALNVPFLGSVADMAGLVLLFIVATLGVGFAISAVSSTDNQAVQLSMLVLLLSIFFSGLLLPLEYFADQFRIVGYLLPLTHSIIGMQQILLQGTSPTQFTWVSLMLISVVTMIVVIVVSQWHFRHVT